MKTTATRQTVKMAINAVNESFGYELRLNRDDQSGKWYNFTLKSASGIPGSRTSGSGRNLACASWHAHGYVFDATLKLEPDAVIKSLNLTIDKNGGNWQDKNVGPQFRPCYFSETSIL